MTKTCIIALLLFLPLELLASTYHFEGELIVYDTTGNPIGPSDASGYVDFDPVTGQGSGGTIQEFLPKTGGATFSDIQIGGIGSDLFDVDFNISFLDSDFDGTLTWEITELGDGNLSAITVDGNGDNIPGLPLSNTTPFPGFSIALNGLLTPVPVPAAIWLFGSGLLGLLGVTSRCRLRRSTFSVKSA